MRLRKNNFTLIEILIALMIIGAALGVIGMNVPSLVRKERFENAVAQVLEEISFAENVMMLHGANIILTLKTEDKGLRLQYFHDGSTGEVPKKKMGRHLFLKGIEKITFDGKELSTLDLVFRGDLFKITKGAITFFSRDNKKTIFLPGYAAPIKKQQDDEKKYKSPIYPEEVLPFI